MDNSDTNLISSNHITDIAGGATAYAIEIVAATCDNNYLVGNRYSGTGGDTINDAGTGTIYGSQLYGSASAGADLILKPLGNVGIGTTNPDEKLHVHFSNGAALNFDGTWKHGYTELTRAQRKWLQRHGWRLP